MGFVILSRDITKEKVDVIVNSLGIVTNHYGAICKSILHASKSKELQKLIDDKNGKTEVGDMFFTDSYGLPAKKILHLVTPFHKFDKEYTAFETAIRDLLNLCRASGYKSISIPILGTGANGYNPIEAQNILISMCAGFADAYKDMDIRVVKKPVHIKPIQLDADLIVDDMLVAQCIHRDIDKFESSMADYYKDKEIKQVREERDYDAKFFEDKKEISPAKWIKEDYDEERPDVVFSNEERQKFDLDEYINHYLIRRYKDDWYKQDSSKKKINIYVGDGNTKQGSKYYYTLVYGTAQVPNRIKMFKIALALTMNENETIDLLSTFGIYPSYKIPVEMCIMSCIRDNIYNMNSIDEELRRQKLGTLFE